MDEAERCKRIVYLSNGRIVVQGAPEVVTRQAGLITFEGTGDEVDDAARQLRHTKGVEAAAVFGRSVHIAGTDRAALEQAVAGQSGLHWQEVEPRLEDVFIHLLSKKQEAA
jgi:ABC-type multidrug transport system ATPase subunit